MLYIFRRLLVMIPTLVGILTLSFFIIQMAPGGPIEQKLQQMRFGGMSGKDSGSASTQRDAGANSEIIKLLEKQYGYDKPIYERYFIWLKNAAQFEFGKSFVYDESVMSVISSRFPISIQFGVVTFILTYLISIPLGIIMAIKANTWIDRGIQLTLYFLRAIPEVVLCIFLIVVFAGASYFNLFPTGGFVSDDYSDLSFWGKVLDRIHHFVLPLIAFIISSFAGLAILMRNSMLEVIRQDYIRTAKAKGLDDRVVYLKHALRNALIQIATGIGDFVGVFLTGGLIVESIFRLDGIGLLSYNSLLARDFNVLMALIFLSSLALLLGRLISDISYILVDPRIDFK